MTCVSVSIKHAGHGHAVRPVDAYSNASCKLMCILMHIPFRIARNIPTEVCSHTTLESPEQVVVILYIFHPSLIRPEIKRHFLICILLLYSISHLIVYLNIFGQVRVRVSTLLASGEHDIFITLSGPQSSARNIQ